MTKNRLWFLIIFYVIFIYLTLTWMRRVVTFLYESLGRDRLSLLINLSLLLGVSLILYVLKRVNPNFSLKRSIWVFGVIFAGVLILLFIAPEERIHLFEYGLLGFLCMRAIGGTSVGSFLKAISVVLIVGVGDEIIQYVLPMRVGDIRDVLLNVVCGVPGTMVQRVIAEGSNS